MNPELQAWIALATPAQLQRLARLSGKSVQGIRHYASGWRKASALAAGRIENASRAINHDTPHLPILLKSALSRACAECPYAPKGK